MTEEKMEDLFNVEAQNLKILMDERGHFIIT